MLNKITTFLLTQIVVALFAFSLAHSPVEAPPVRYTGPVEVVRVVTLDEALDASLRAGDGRLVWNATGWRV